jgi:hypothetical protein
MKYGTNGRLNGRLKLLIIASFAALLATFTATNLLSGLALSPEVSELQRISEDHARAVALIAQFRGEVGRGSKKQT